MTEPSGLGAVAQSVIDLGKTVEGIDRRVRAQGSAGRHTSGQLDQQAQQIAGLAQTVAGLADAVAELVASTEREKRGFRTSWLDEPVDRDDDDPRPVMSWARWQLDGLADWLAKVYLWYPDAKLPPCWAWHPDVVEELLWLRDAWYEAYRGKTAAPFRQADWHDRYRPGVVKRIGDRPRCSVREHVAPDGTEYVKTPPRVGLAERRSEIAAWWSANRTGAPPSATPDDVREAEAQ